MENTEPITDPFSFNALKHHLGYVTSFIDHFRGNSKFRVKELPLSEINRIGKSVTDFYTGILSVKEILTHIENILARNGLKNREDFKTWIERENDSSSTVTLSDKSSWVIKCLTGNKNYIHIFPSRNSEFTIRIRGNTLKSAIMLALSYQEADISVEKINGVRALLKLSPVNLKAEAKAIVEVHTLLISGI